LLAREAQAIARRLAALLESAPKIVVERSADGRETPRPIRAGDIAILFRSLTDVQAYEKALADLGLPYYLVGGKAFYSQQELFDLSNLLRVLEQPSDEVSLVGVLRSPFFSLTDETIFWLSQEKGGLSAGLFSDSLSPNIDDAQQEAVRFAAKTLRTLRGQKDRLSITALINLALELTGFDAALVADFLGERKLANLRKLLEIARVYDQSGFASLADFVVQLSEFEASQPDEALAAVHAESSDVIRLMTIHQAKGLEFPMVVVADVDRPGRYPRAKAAFDPKWGPLVGLSNDPDRPECPTGLDLYLRQVDQAERQERTRLFYVATTRAADYLILSSSVTDFAEPAGPWAKLLAKRFDLESGRPLERWPADCPQVAIAVTKNPEPPNCEKVEQSRADLTNLIESTDEPCAPDASKARDIKHIEPDGAARRVFSFSRLTGKLKERRDWVEEKNEAQSENERTDAAALGKLIHAVLAEMTWDGSRDIASLAARHAERLLIDQRPLIDEAIKLVERFSTTELAPKLHAATEIHRELEFLLAWPPDTPRADTAPLFYGFIDCLYCDREGHWHLVDYKSNDVTAKRARTEARRYEPQLGLYALACEKVLNKPVASLTLHFLRPGVDVTCQWDVTARQRTIEAISAALAGEFSTKLS
jgi:ATP-dependent helicase/nuclease subunit A